MYHIYIYDGIYFLCVTIDYTGPIEDQSIQNRGCCLRTFLVLSPDPYNVAIGSS